MYQRWKACPEQVDELTQLGPQHVELGWEAIAKAVSALGRNRTATACRKRWQWQQKQASPEQWVEPVDDEILTTLVENPEVDTDEWLDALEQLQKLTQRADPVYTFAESKIESSKPIAIQLVADIHLGSRWVCYPEFREALERALDTPRLFWGVHGEWIEGFTPDFRAAYPVLEQLVKPKIQRALAARIIKKLTDAGKLLYGCGGTEAHTGKRAVGEDLVRALYQRHNIPHFVGKGIWQLSLGTKSKGYQKYVFFVGHQLPGSSQYNPNHPQIRALLWDCPVADFIISGHTHKFAQQEIYHHETAYRAGIMPVNKTHLVNIGTAKTGADPYAISKWSEGIFSWPIYILHPDEHKIKRIYEGKELSYYLGN